MKRFSSYILCSLALMVLGCTPEAVQTRFADSSSKHESDAKYVGQAVGNFAAEEWYPGGLLGTTENVTEGCYEDEAPVVNTMGLAQAFNLGEAAFERNFTINTAPFKGLGPTYLRSSCLDCHPGYGHGKRQEYYKAGYGNGYLLVVYHPADGANSDDGPYVAEVTGMPQTKAVAPFLPPVDEDQIRITWIPVAQMESGLISVYFCVHFMQQRAMKRRVFILLGALLASAGLSAQVMPQTQGRLTIGGYGEVALTRNFFSDNVYRYSHPDNYRNDPSHGRFDIPHAVIYLGYDFGKGWTMQTEIEFEHTGSGGAVEKEFTEAGEWEAEVEKGGEVELEQFWIQKSFAPQFNVRIGHLVVPVGGLNNAHGQPLPVLYRGGREAPYYGQRP